MQEKVTSTKTVSRPRGISTYSAADLCSVALCGIALFLLTGAVALLLNNGVNFYRYYGFHSVMQDFYLHRFLIFSLLPVGFNLAFGIAFGMYFISFRRTTLARFNNGFLRVLFSVVLNPAFLLFLLWWILFNLPLLLEPVDPRYLTSSWPPHSLYLPIRTELLLFHPLGNRALVAGFLGAIGWKRLRQLLAAEKPKG